MLIYKGLSHLCGSVFVMGGLHVLLLCLNSLGIRVFKGTMGSLFEGFFSFSFTFLTQPLVYIPLYFGFLISS
jgi:hypothetical protein